MEYSILLSLCVTTSSIRMQLVAIINSNMEQQFCMQSIFPDHTEPDKMTGANLHAVHFP